MATSTIDLDTLKRELKAWEKQFKLEHGRDIGKDDMKANPDIAAKYKLWRDMSKQVKAPAKAEEDKRTNAPTAEPTTPRPSRKSRKDPKPAKAIISKPVPTATNAPVISSNPFSPVKRLNPAASFKTPTKPKARPAASSSSGELENPFAPSSSSSKPSGRNIFSRAAYPPSPEPTAAAPSSSRTANDDYLYADSPKKLKQLIHSVKGDTPRTKSRKRLRGEDVPFTPGDKRKPLKEKEKEGEEEEDEELELSPVKPVAGKQKSFQALFEDEATELSKTDTKKSKTPFFGSSSRLSGPSNLFSKKDADKPGNLEVPRASGSSREASKSRSTSVTTDVEVVSTKSRKRSLPDDEDPVMDTDSFTEPTPLVDPPTAITNTDINHFLIHPPSPVLGAAKKGVKKSKWNDKKGKAIAVANLPDYDDDVDEDMDEVEGMIVKVANPAERKAQATGDDLALEVDHDTRFKTGAIITATEPILADEDEVDVDMLDPVLKIDSPSKRDGVAEELLMKDVLAGRGGPKPSKLKGLEVWDVGDVGAEQSEGEDWDGEPVAWEDNVEM